MQDPVPRFTGQENLKWVLIPLGSLSSSLRRSVVIRRTNVIMQMGKERRFGQMPRSRQAYYVILSPSYSKILRLSSLLFASQCVCTKCLDVLIQSYPGLTPISSQTRISVELKLTQYVAPPF